MPASDLTLTQRKRRDILSACTEEFRDHGFAAARIDRIAERAQVSKRTLYKHFESKEAMFDAIMANVLSPMPREEKMALDPDRTLKQQLGDLLETYMRTISGDDYITLSRVIVSEFIHDPERSRGTYARSEVASGPLEDLIAQAIHAGLLRTVDVEYAATQLSAMLKAFFFWPKFLNGLEAPKAAQGRQVIDDCVDMFLGHYGIRQQA